MSVPSETIEAIARGFFQETWSYGFQQVDYVRFVNQLLDLAMRNGRNGEKKAVHNLAIDLDAPPKGFPLVGERVTIRPFPGDEGMQLLERWVEDELGRYFLLSRVTGHHSDIKDLIEDPGNVLGLITLTDQTPIGLVAYLNWDRVQRKAELRKLIGEKEHRGRGLAKEATRLWIRYGLSSLGLRKIYLNTLDTNVRNIKLNEELGFRVEGILRNECYFDGRYHDVLRMALLAEETVSV